jgi:hypothetical protein
MKVSKFEKLDSEELAEASRRLANEIQHALSNPFVTGDRVNEISRRIHVLRKRARETSLCEIGGWLHRLQRQVEAHRSSVRRTTRA